MLKIIKRKKAEQLLKTKQRKGEKIDLDELKSLKIDPWKGARITTVPLDFAVSLVSLFISDVSLSNVMYLNIFAIYVGRLSNQNLDYISSYLQLMQMLLMH